MVSPYEQLWSIFALLSSLIKLEFNYMYKFLSHIQKTYQQTTYFIFKALYLKI